MAGGAVVAGVGGRVVAGGGGVVGAGVVSGGVVGGGVVGVVVVDGTGRATVDGTGGTAEVVVEETATLANSTWRDDEEDKKWPAATGTKAVKEINPAMADARIRSRATRRRGC